MTRLWWLVLVGAVAGGAFGSIVTSRAAPGYQSVAVVVGTSDLSTDSFDSAARVLFGTSTVLQPVIDALGLNATPRSLLSAGKLAIERVSGAIALRIVGQASDPADAEDLARTAANSFAGVGATYDLGNLKALEPNSAARLVPPTVRNAGVSAIAGGLLVVAVVLLVFIIRQPMVDEGQAREALAAETSFAAHVRMKKPGVEPKEGTEHGTRSSRIVVAPTGVFAAVRRAVVAPGSVPERAAYTIVLVPGRGRAGRAAGAIAEELGDAQAVPTTGPPPDGDHPVVSSDDGAIGAALERTRAVVVVVPDRAACRALRRLEEKLRVAPCVERRVVLLVD